MNLSSLVGMGMAAILVAAGAGSASEQGGHDEGGHVLLMNQLLILSARTDGSFTIEDSLPNGEPDQRGLGNLRVIHGMDERLFEAEAKTVTSERQAVAMLERLLPGHVVASSRDEAGPVFHIIARDLLTSSPLDRPVEGFSYQGTLAELPAFLKESGPVFSGLTVLEGSYMPGSFIVTLDASAPVRITAFQGRIRQLLTRCARAARPKACILWKATMRGAGSDRSMLVDFLPDGGGVR